MPALSPCSTVNDPDPFLSVYLSGLLRLTSYALQSNMDKSTDMSLSHITKTSVSCVNKSDDSVILSMMFFIIFSFSYTKYERSFQYFTDAY